MIAETFSVFAALYVDRKTGKSFGGGMNIGLVHEEACEGERIGVRNSGDR
jgi:hypothetical protein